MWAWLSRSLPPFRQSDAAREEAVAEFAAAFFERDPMARQLLNHSNISLFSQGYRPTIGIPYDPEQGGARFSDLRAYFVRKLVLDVSSLATLDRASFQRLTDYIGSEGDKTVICAGEIAVRYGLQVEGRFNWEAELRKVPEGPERETFKRCWLNDAILGTELRMLAWMYQQMFGQPYVNPERRC